jgi:putative phosphoribosyl transferase
MFDRTARPFRDRQHAGRVLAEHLMSYANNPGVLVLALPRGGVPVAAEVASALKAPLEVFVVRKLGTPGHEELAMGAIASGGVRVLNQDVVQMLHLTPDQIERVAVREQQELERRELLYRGTRPFPELRDRIVILVDDGLATGSTMRAAAQAVRQQRPSKVVVGVPVAAPETCREFREEVDEIVCAVTPQAFYAVGLWYDNFEQTTDDEVRVLLERSARELVSRDR